MSDDGADLTIVIPIWRRTKNVPRLADSIRSTVPKAETIYVVNDDDDAVFDSGLLDGDTDFVVVDWSGGSPGDYAKKINFGYRASDRPFIFTGADDLVFHDGWYAPARALMADYRHSTQRLDGGTLTGPFALMREGAVGVVGTVDLCNDRTMRGEHSTHTLIARWYATMGCSVDQGDMIYDEGYVHEFCDDELVQTAMARRAYAHSFGPPVEHVHMLLDASLDDDVYRHGRSRSRLSRRRFLARQRLWGGTQRSGRR